MQTSLLFTLFSLVNAFKNKIRFLWFVDCYHLHAEVIFWLDDQSRERLLANLALKFSEIIGYDHSSDFFFYLAIDPHF